MKSIQSKFIVLILGCTIVSSFIVGVAGIMHAKHTAEETSMRAMNLLCKERAQEINALLSRISQSVRTLAIYASAQLHSVEQLKTDPYYLQEYTKQLETVAVNAARNTEGAMAVYVRFNPAFTPPTSGLFWSKTALDGNFRRQEPTDFSGFSPKDTEHVGWYYIPVQKGKATWLAPYLNKNTNVCMISFVIPLYMESQTIGVVGMDIDLAVITDTVNNIHLYDSGYAFLADSAATVVHHRSIPSGTPLTEVEGELRPVIEALRSVSSTNTLFSYSWQGQPKRMAFRLLNNDMNLAITAPVAEIDASRNRLIWQMGMALLIISTCITLLTVHMTRRLIRPLKELSTAAQKIANGDMNVSLTQHTKDEVGMLAESFQQTVQHLQSYIQYINDLAYRDSLTGVKNKTAYQDMEASLEKKMRLEKPEFALVVLDINCLKYVNDAYGHDFGDMLIINASRIICKTFKHSPVFRLGGDEFVIVLEGSDYQKRFALQKKFQEDMEEFNSGARVDMLVSIAHGMAEYNSATDMVFANVFKRADDAMYKNKAIMKAAMATYCNGGHRL